MILRGLRRSFSDFSRHPWLHAISIATMTTALFILGIYFLIYRNVRHVAEVTSPQITGTIYLKEALPPAQVQTLRERVLTLSHVEKVIFKNKTSVISELEEYLGSKTDSTLLGAGELFPDILEIVLDKNASAKEVLVVNTVVSQFPEVVESDYSESWLSQFEKIKSFFHVFGGLLMIGLMTSCTFIIANFMGMRHQSRKNEIDIVRLIGAHEKFVLSPFLWEGLIEGLIGVVFALGLTYVAKSVSSFLMSSHWSSLIGMREWLFLSTGQLAVLATFGITMALLGSLTVFFRFQQGER